MAGLLPVLMGVPFLTMRAAVLVALPFGAGARVDVGEVGRVGLGEVTQLELDDDPARCVLEGSGAAHAGVALGVQIEHHISALGMSRVVLLGALGSATAAPD
jgi:carbon monoxide dehydrogenase subunit G